MAHDDRERDEDESAVLDEDFESTLRESLRGFEVMLSDGSIERLFAHFHDASSPAGHLSFVTITATGHHTISRLFNGHRWQDLREITDHHQPTVTAREELVTLQKTQEQQDLLKQQKVIPITRKLVGKVH